MRIIKTKRECCAGCGLAWNRLFDAFTNGRGWRRLCAKCSDPQGQDAPKAAYRGPYPILPRPALTVVDGGAR